MQIISSQHLGLKVHWDEVSCSTGFLNTWSVYNGDAFLSFEAP